MLIADKIRKNQPDLYNKLKDKFELKIPESKSINEIEEEENYEQFMMYKKLMEERKGFKL